MDEIWKNIPNYEHYQVSNFGSVRSLDRKLTNSLGVKSLRKGKVLKPQKCSNGYLFVLLGRGKSHLVHRLVAESFINKIENASQVNHIDGDRSNNSVLNLEWVSCSDNHKHSYRNLNRKLHKSAKVIVLAKGGRHKKFYGCNSAAEFLGVNAGSVASAANRKHKCKGWVVKYETCEIERFGQFQMAKLSGERES